MQVFELHFNPKAKEDLIFDSFCYEPENVYEKRLGNLYIIGELKNTLPQNLRFLNQLAKVIKGKYYTFSFKSAERALSESLKTANEFLAEEVKKENVSWLGNLSLAVLGLTTNQKNSGGELNFTKVGSLKVFLLRNSQITEVSRNLEFSEIEPYPLKIFGNIVSGKLAKDDKILLLTKEVSEYFLSQNLLNEIAKADSLNEKKLKEVLKPKEKELLEISGICFLIQVQPEIQPKYAQLFRKEPEKFSLSQLYLPIPKALKSIKQKPQMIVKKLTGKIDKNKLKFAQIPKISFPKITSPKIPSFKLKTPNLRKNLILILIFIFFLSIGFIFFQGEREENLRLARQALEKAESKKVQAENFLILKDEEKANLLFQEAWKDVLPQTEIGASLREEALLLKESIEEILIPLNKLEEIDEPELVLEFQPEEINIIPQRILASNSFLYFFNPFSSSIYKFQIEATTGKLLQANRNLKLGVVFSGSILFFSNPDILISLENDKFQEKILQPLSSGFNFNQLSSFKENIYFLDTQSGQIAKYSPQNLEEDTPLIGELWLSSKTKKSPKSPVGWKAMAIDGAIWILAKENEIDRYYGGFYRETLKLDFFPYLENPTKIWTSVTSPYLYLLEPNKNRMIILTKYGEIVKQFQSEKFDNLLDFTVSENETIYLLNGLKVYQIKL